MITFYNSAGDGLSINIYCNTRHHVSAPTIMLDVPSIDYEDLTPSFIKEGQKLRCPICGKEVVVVVEN